jgi:nucleotide-binding universal stress UspA family protein
MYARILVATDGSTLSKKAVNSAISLAALCGAELIAIKGGSPLSAELFRRLHSPIR